MDQSLSNRNQLPERHLINSEMIAQTAHQIEKDLRLDKLVLSDSGKETTPFEQLFAALLPHVEKIMSQNPASLPQHLYQVDLPEKITNMAITSDDPSRTLTECIIKRCFQKVILRQIHRSGKM